MKVFTREKAKEILLERGDKCLVVPEGYTETTADFALLYDEEDIRCHFTSIQIASTVEKINGVVLTAYDPYTCDVRFFKEFLVSEENEKYCSVDGVLFSKDMKELLVFPCGKYLKEYKIPYGTEKIACCAFSFNCFLKNIVLPDTIKHIGDRAFECSDRLENINIPKNIESIGKECFQFAGSIHRIFIPDSLNMINSSTITSAGVFVFPETLKKINVDFLQTDYTGKFVEPVLLSKNNPVVEDFAETYGFNYFSDYVIDENGIIWSPDYKTLIDFPQNWHEETYTIPLSVECVFRWAFNYSDIKHVVFDHKIKILGDSYGEDFSRLCSVDVPRYDKDFIIQSVMPEDANKFKYLLGSHENMTPLCDASNRNYVFISYSSREIDIANQLKHILETNGINCWMAPQSIPAGSDYGTEIPQAIENCKAFLLLLSDASQHSNWVPKEIGLAIGKGKIVVPFQIDDAAIVEAFNFYLTNSQRISAYNRTTEAYQELISRLKDILK